MNKKNAAYFHVLYSLGRNSRYGDSKYVEIIKLQVRQIAIKHMYVISEDYSGGIWSHRGVVVDISRAVVLG